MIQKLFSVAIAIFLSTPVFAQSALPTYVPTNGLSAYYNLDSNANDLSGNGNNGVANNVLSVADRHGNLNGAYAFNGVTSHVMINPTTASLDIKNGSSAVSAWVKLNPAIVGFANQNIFWRGDTLGGQDPYTLGIGASSYYYLRDATFNRDTISKPLVDTLFHHLLATYDSATAVYNLYFDGVLIRSKTGVVSINYNTNNMWNVIGAIDRGQHQNFRGVIDDIAVYSRALSACEVWQLYTEQADTVTQQPANTTAGVGTSATFSTAFSATGATYKWQVSTNGTTFFDLNNIGTYSGVNTPTLIVNPVVANNYSEYYRCRINVATPCEQFTQTARILQPQSVSGLDAEAGLEIFPNPVVEQLTIHFANAAFEGASLRITNLVGQRIYDAKIPGKNLVLPRSIFGAPGFYQVQVSDKAGIFKVVRKVVVE